MKKSEKVQRLRKLLERVEKVRRGPSAKAARHPARELMLGLTLPGIPRSQASESDLGQSALSLGNCAKSLPVEEPEVKGAVAPELVLDAPEPEIEMPYEFEVLGNPLAPEGPVVPESTAEEPLSNQFEAPLVEPLGFTILPDLDEALIPVSIPAAEPSGTERLTFLEALDASLRLKI